MYEKGSDKSKEVEIYGHSEPRFEQVKQAFKRNFDEGAEIGASFAVTVNGKYVIDIWGGYKDKELTIPWEKDTICNVYSTTKVPTMLCTMMCVDRGLLDLDEKVATYWPEFAQNGKENVLVRHCLSHSAGLPGIQERVSSDVWYDWEMVISLLAAQEKPLWEPGTKSGYHSFTQGYLLGELVKKVTGKTLGTFFKEEIANPLKLDFHIGLAEEHVSRVAKLAAVPLSLENMVPVMNGMAYLANISNEIKSLLDGVTKSFIINYGEKNIFTGVIKSGNLEFVVGKSENPHCEFISEKDHPDAMMALFSPSDEESDFVSKYLKKIGSSEDVVLLKKLFELITKEIREKAPIEIKMKFNPIPLRDYSSDRKWQAAEIPAANGHGNARSIAKIASIIACGGELDGIRFISKATLEKILEEQIYDVDLVIGERIRWGLGIGLPGESRPHIHPRTAYWGGLGGSAIIMDLDARIGISYVPNQMRQQPPLETVKNRYHEDTRGNRLITAVWESLGYI